MGLDELHLRVLATSSDDVVEKKNAQKGVQPSSAAPFVPHRPSLESHAQGPPLGPRRQCSRHCPLRFAHPCPQVLLLANVVRTPSLVAPPLSRLA